VTSVRDTNDVVRGNLACPTLKALEADPARLAISEPGGRCIMYGEMWRRVVALTETLRAEGLQPGDRVLLVAPNGIDLAASALAILLAGGVLVFCEPGLGDAVYQAQVRATAPRWMLVHPLVRWLNRVPFARVLLRRFEAEVPPLPAGVPGLVQKMVSCDRFNRHSVRQPPATDCLVMRLAGDDAAIVLTGGTTGRPRGVRLSHAALEHSIGHLASTVAGLQTERLLADTPQQVLYGLRLGKSVFVGRGRRDRRARHALHMIRGGIVDSYFGAPYIWVRMMEMHAGRLPPTLRTVLLGGAPVTRDFLHELRDRLDAETQVLTLYGLTEAGLVCAARAEEKLGWSGTGDLVGAAVEGIRLDVVEKSLDGVGEVVVHSPSLYTGYIGEPERPQGVGLRTGDLGRLVEVGGRAMLALVGRTKDMIVRRGVNIYPGLLEPVVREMQSGRGPLVRQCALVGVWNALRQDEDVVLCVEPVSGYPTSDLPELRRRVAFAVGPDAAPDRVLVVRPMPLTGRQNKIDRVALRERAAALVTPAARSLATLEVSPACGRPLPGPCVPFDFRAFFRKNWAMLQADRQPIRVVSGAALRLLLAAVVQVGWVWDEMAHHRWRVARMRGPLFILGHQRSGTTLLHRLLSRDALHARALTLHEMLLPAVGLQHLLRGLAAMDRFIGGALWSILDRFQARLFGPLDDVHRLRLDEIEEDEFALWTIYASAMCANDSPTAATLPDLDALRQFDSWTARRQAEVLRWYHACLLKKVYREPGDPGAPPWVVAKNPAFTQKITSLRREFPDGRFLLLYRSPLEAIPSRLRLVRAIWRCRCRSFREMTPGQVQAIYSDSVRTYLAAERDIPLLPQDVTLTVRFPELVSDPQATVARICTHFGLPGSRSGMVSSLSQQGRTHPVSSPSHRQGLVEFGLDEARVRRDLAPVFNRYEGDCRTCAGPP
jgi:acyl-CoA synthetase (AMP-forming)/AMP-acid ligase II